MPVALSLLSRSRKPLHSQAIASSYHLVLTTSSRLSPKCVKIGRPTLFGYIETREEFEFYTNELFSLLKSGQLKVKIHKVYPLEQAEQAQRVCLCSP